jgi:hypothetical protein
MEDEINLYVDYVVQNIPIADARLDRIRKETAIYTELAEVLTRTKYGWADHEKGLHHEIKPYFAI